MATSSQVSVQDYLRDFSKSSCEFVDGVVIEKAMPTWMHSVLQGWLCGLIMNRYSHYVAGSEVHARLRESEYRLPDIAVQLESVLKHETYAARPPLLCVEILSPDDRLGATFAKCESYHDWGVPMCWVIDAEKRRAWVYAKDGEPVLEGTVLEAGDIRLPLADVFQRFNKLTQAD